MCLNILDYWTCWSWGWGTAWKWKGEGESETCDDCNFHKEMGRGWMWKFGWSEGCSLFCTCLWILIMSFTILKMKLHINLLKYLPFPFSCYFILSRSWCLLTWIFLKSGLNPFDLGTTWMLTSLGVAQLQSTEPLFFIRFFLSLKISEG